MAKLEGEKQTSVARAGGWWSRVKEARVIFGVIEVFYILYLICANDS